MNDADSMSDSSDSEDDSNDDNNNDYNDESYHYAEGEKRKKMPDDNDDSTIIPCSIANDLGSFRDKSTGDRRTDQSVYWIANPDSCW